MKLRLILSCLLCATYIAAEDSKPSRPTEANRDFFAIGMDILQRGTAFIDLLAEHQVGSVISDVYSSANEMKIAKEDLRTALLTDNLSRAQLQSKIEPLRQKVWTLNQSLKRFAAEINRISDLNTGSLLEAANSVTNSKVEELDQIMVGWQAGSQTSRDAALEHLNRAIGYSQSLMDIAKCLKESVDGRKAACDPKKLQEQPDQR